MLFDLEGAEVHVMWSHSLLNSVSRDTSEGMPKVQLGSGVHEWDLRVFCRLSWEAFQSHMGAVAPESVSCI
eukprot:4205485-Amphidinium_carterae.1